MKHLKMHFWLFVIFNIEHRRKNYQILVNNSHIYLKYFLTYSLCLKYNCKCRILLCNFYVNYKGLYYICILVRDLIEG